MQKPMILAIVLAFVPFSRGADFTISQLVKSGPTMVSVPELAAQAWRERIKELASQALVKSPLNVVLDAEPRLLYSAPKKANASGERRYIHTWEAILAGKRCQFSTEGWDFNGRYDARLGRLLGAWCLPR